MDEKENIKNEALKEDFDAFKTLMQAAAVGGGDIVLEVIHQRAKKPDTLKHFTSPSVTGYIERLEGKVDTLQNTLKSKKEEGKRQSKYIKELSQKHDELKNQLKEVTTFSYKFSELEEKVNKYEILEEENKALKEENKTLKGEKEKSECQFKRFKEEKEEAEKCYIEYIEQLEAESKKLKEEKEEAKNRNPSFVGKGKSTEMPPRIVREAIRLYGMGESIKSIEASTGASRGQIYRLLRGAYKTEYSRKKALKEINKLLRVNQNKDFIEKLKGLKSKYE